MTSEKVKPEQRPIHILVVGAGAVGCFYASRLHHPDAGVLVSLVCRSNYETIASNGVHLQTRDFGEYHFTPHRVFSSIPQAGRAAREEEGEEQLNEGRGWDYVILTTKALPDRVDDSLSLQPVVSLGNGSGGGSSSGSTGGGGDDQPGPCLTKIALIQNGVGIEKPHRERFPTNPIVSCVTVISAEQVRDGVIVQNRWTRISLGPYSDGLGEQDDPSSSPSSSSTSSPTSSLSKSSIEAMNFLQTYWTRGGIKDAETHSEKDLQLIRWHKLTINAAMNPSAVLSGGTGNADMVLQPELRTHIRGVMDEIAFLAPRILHVPSLAFPPHLKLADAERIIRSTERNKGAKPSMLLDWEAGRPMELEVILGNPVRMAREKGLPCPRMQSMYALLKAAQDRREERQRQRQDQAGKGSKL